MLLQTDSFEGGIFHRAWLIGAYFCSCFFFLDGLVRSPLLVHHSLRQVCADIVHSWAWGLVTLILTMVCEIGLLRYVF